MLLQSRSICRSIGQQPLQPLAVEADLLRDVQGGSQRASCFRATCCLQSRDQVSTLQQSREEACRNQLIDW